jgi:hypothetical protein
MIALAADCLLFEMATGERIPYSADMVSVELGDSTTGMFDSEFVGDATKAVFHYFKHELGRHSVSVVEFEGALQKVLSDLAATAQPSPMLNSSPRVLECDLCGLALESGPGRELLFFPRLRVELQRSLRQSPRVLRFRGLRACIKHLTGARRWSRRCRTLEGEIVDYLRECLRAVPAPVDCALIVE